MLAAVASGPAGRAQTVAPIPAPTIITSAPYTISKPGYYQLGADLTVSATSGNIITVAASNVTLDFAGHYISGPSNSAASQLYGVYANEQGNLVIRNGTIAYCLVGIELAGNGSATSININQRIDNMLVSYCYYIGIFCDYTRNSTVSNCAVSSIGGTTTDGFAYGIRGFGTGVNIINNVVTTVTSSTNNAFGIDTGSYVANNRVSAITSTGNGSTTWGIYNPTFAVNNTIDTASYGIEYGKYSGNLTNNCTTPFANGTAVGTNN